MKIRITSRGIYGVNGELAIGSEHEVSSAIPPGWRQKVLVLDEAPVEALPVTNPADEAPVEAPIVTRKPKA